MAFELPALPYEKDALAPHISAETLEYHYGKHHAGYVKKLNAAAESDPSIAGKSLEDLVRTDDRFEIPVRRELGLVCFRLKGADDLSRALLERINASGAMMLTHSVVPVGHEGEDRYVIRFAVGAPRTRERHVREARERIATEANAVLAESSRSG